MDRTPRLACFAVLVSIAALAAAGCGDEGGSRRPSLDEWAEKAGQLCSDGSQEAIALPLPASRSEVATDSAAMAEIVATVRDGILPLGLPVEDEDLAAAYIDQLTADAKLLLDVSEAARQGGDYRTALSRLDESAGERARELGLDECAAFANAVARTP